jgi:hypothetical protein
VTRLACSGGVWPLIAAVAVVGVGVAAWPYTVDDAYVVARFAQHLRGGHGYVMNVGGPPTDGVTGPLWILPMLLGMQVAKATGLACMGAAAAMVVAHARLAGGTWAAGAATAFLAVQPTLGVWGAAGLETGAATLALTAVGLASLQSTSASRAHITGPLGAAVLPWLRPEAVLAAAAAGGARVLGKPRGWITVAALGLGLVTVVAFRWAMFDHPLPLSASAKPPHMGHGLAYAGRALVATGSLAALALFAATRVERRRTLTPLVAIASVHWIAVVVAGGDWMPGYRLVAPALPLMALLAGLSVESSRLPRAAAALGLAIVCAVPALDMAAQLPEVREAGRRREEVGRPLAEAIGRRFNHVALVDAGHIPWVAGVQVFDLAGLTEPRVARAAGGHLDKRFDPRLLASEPIDAIVLHAAVPPRVDAAGRLVSLAGHPVEQRVAAHPWVRAHFRVVQVVQYAPHYHYVVLAQDDPRGP